MARFYVKGSKSSKSDSMMEEGTGQKSVEQNHQNHPAAPEKIFLMD